VCLSVLTDFNLKKLSSLMSAAPSRILKLDTGASARGRIAPGLRADLIIADPLAKHTVDASRFLSRGVYGPFNKKTVQGEILMTIHKGRIVYDKTH